MAAYGIIVSVAYQVPNIAHVKRMSDKQDAPAGQRFRCATWHVCLQARNEQVQASVLALALPAQ
jgi:hypothetical protein